MAARWLIPLIVGLVAFIHAVRPTDPYSPSSNTSSQHDAEMNIELDKFEESLSKTHMDAVPMRVGVAPTSALITLDTLKNISTRSEVEPRRHTRSSREHMRPDKGVNIAEAWEDYEFNILDEDGGGKIEKAEWDKLVKGQWSALMWTALDVNPTDGDIDTKEWKDNWDPAVDAAFGPMGGADDQKIDEEEVKKFQATEKEKEFATKSLMGDGGMTCTKSQCMDRSQFEEFIYVVIFVRALEKGGDAGALDFKKFEEAVNGKDKLAGMKTAFPADEKAWEEKMGGKEMTLGGCLIFLNEQTVFTSSDPELNNAPDDKVVENAKSEDEALAEAEGKGKSGSVRAVLAHAVVALTTVCTWQPQWLEPL